MNLSLPNDQNQDDDFDEVAELLRKEFKIFEEEETYDEEMLDRSERAYSRLRNQEEYRKKTTDELEEWFLNMAVKDPQMAERVFFGRLIKNKNLNQIASYARRLHKEHVGIEDIKKAIIKTPIFLDDFKECITDEPVSVEDKEAFNEIFQKGEIETLIKQQIEFAESKQYQLAPEKLVSLISKGIKNLDVPQNQIVKCRTRKDLHAWIKSVAVRVDRRVQLHVIQLDIATGGGLKTGCVYCIAGTSGDGKSLILCWLAGRMLKHGKSILFVSTEMVSDEILIRVYQSMTGSKAPEEAFMKMDNWIANHGDYKGMDIMLANEMQTTVADIRNKAIKGNYEAIIVDYGDKLSSGFELLDNEYRKQGIVFSQLATLAKELDLPILVASQLNRTAIKNKKAGAETISDSYDKVRPLEMLFNITSFDPQSNPEMENKKELYISKNRDGKKDYPIVFDVDYDSWSLKEDAEVSELLKNAKTPQQMIDILMNPKKTQKCMVADEVDYDSRDD